MHQEISREIGYPFQHGATCKHFVSSAGEEEQRSNKRPAEFPRTAKTWEARPDGVAGQSRSTKCRRGPQAAVAVVWQGNCPTPLVRTEPSGRSGEHQAAEASEAACSPAAEGDSQRVKHAPAKRGPRPVANGAGGCAVTAGDPGGRSGALAVCALPMRELPPHGEHCGPVVRTYEFSRARGSLCRTATNRH